MDGTIEGAEESDRLVRELSASPHLRRTRPRFRRPSGTCPAAGRENPDDSSLIHINTLPTFAAEARNPQWIKPSTARFARFDNQSHSASSGHYKESTVATQPRR